MSTLTRSAGMNRHVATRRVMKSIAVGPRVVSLPFTAPDGSKPLVVTTPGEYLSAVIERVMALGGSANVALADAKGFSIFVIESDADAEEGPVDDLFNDDMSMGMFHIKTRTRSHGRGSRDATFRLRGAEVARIPAVASEFAYA
jgi:hypothetical protein